MGDVIDIGPRLTAADLRKAILAADDINITWAELSLGTVILELVHYRTGGADPTDVDVKRAGGLTVAQEPGSAVVGGIAAAAIALGAAEDVAGVDALTSLMAELAKR